MNFITVIPTPVNFITLKTNTMKNRCKNSNNMFYNIIYSQYIQQF